MKFLTATMFAVAAYASPAANVTKFDWNGQFAKDSKKEVTMSGDVKFFWTGGHNVREVPDKAAFDACTRKAAVEIPGGEKTGVVVKGEVGKTRYFICEVGDHCSRGQKVAITWKEATAATSGAMALQAAGAFAIAALVM